MIRTLNATGLSMSWRIAATVSVFAVLSPAWAADDAVDQDARQILRRAIGAAGGARALDRMKSPMMWMEKGVFHGMGAKTPFVAQYAVRWPDWYRQEIENAFVITVVGRKAWVTVGSDVQKLEGDVLQERLKQVRMAWGERLFPLMDKPYTLSKIDGVAINGRPTIGINASHTDGRDIKFYFDKETYLIAKTEAMVVSPQHGLQPVLAEAFYSNHKSFGAGKVPTKLRLFYAKKLFVESETVDYKMGATLDPKQFQAPK